ncbi:hypothetical protein GCM10020220_051090 [Nonomuraea rubra]
MWVFAGAPGSPASCAVAHEQVDARIMDRIRSVLAALSLYVLGPSWFHGPTTWRHSWLPRTAGVGDAFASVAVCHGLQSDPVHIHISYSSLSTCRDRVGRGGNGALTGTVGPMLPFS